MLLCSHRCSAATAWCDHYDAVQTCALVLLYLQVACALVGSLGAVYTGIVLANLALALFALIAIESGSQSLGRAYAGLLALALLLDIAWFILFTNEISQIWNGTQLGKFGAFSVELMFWMQAIGSGLRFISSFLWCQMYRLGAISGTSSTLPPVDFDVRNSILGDDSESEVLGDPFTTGRRFPPFLKVSVVRMTLILRTARGQGTRAALRGRCYGMSRDYERIQEQLVNSFLLICKMHSW